MIRRLLLPVAFATALVAQTSQASEGVRNVVLVHGAWADGSSWAKVIALLEKAGLNAVSAYRPAFGGTVEGAPYAQLWDNIRDKFINGPIGLGSNPKRELVVPLMSGASHEPRHELHPEQFGAQHYREPAPGEFKAHLLAGLDWAFAHQKNCPAQSVLIYAWNEHSEGGFICPTMGAPPDYKPNTRLLDELAAAIREWSPQRN